MTDKGTTQKKKNAWLARSRETIEKTEAQLANIESKEKTITQIKLEGMALLKIIRHCDSAVVDSDSIFGTLCGLVDDNILEITDCFPVSSDVGNDHVQYQADMLKIMGEMKRHNLPVGWYRCAFYNDFFADSKIPSIQHTWQMKFPSSVILVYDPLNTRHGRLALKAFRLKKPVMKILSSSQGQMCSAEILAQIGVSTHDVFEEVPIVLRNHHLIQAFLFELKQQGSINISGESLAMHNQNDVVDMMTRMGDTVRKFREQNDKYRKYIRDMRDWNSEKEKFVNSGDKRKTPEQRAGEFEKIKRDQKPDALNRLDSVLCTTLMDSLSEEMLEAVQNDFLRIWVTKGI